MKSSHFDFVIIAIILAIGIIGTEFMANKVGHTYFGFEQPKVEIKTPKTAD